MKVGVALPYWADRPPREALEVAANAERFGFDELWCGELRTFDAFAIAAGVAAVTKTIEIWTGPLPVHTRDPVALALGVASVSAVGGRPAHLALGASSPVVVSRWHGRAWSDSAQRVRETVAALRPLLRGERSPSGFRLHEPPAGPVKIGVAAFGPRMLRAACEVADRVVVNLLTAKQVARARAETGPVPLVAWVPAALDPGPGTIAQLERQLSMYRDAPGYREMLAESGALEAVCALGGPADVRSGLEEYGRAGADVVAVVPATADDPGGEKLLRELSSGRDG